MTTPFKVGEWYHYSGNGHLVQVVEMLPGNRALVRWTTAGRKAQGRRYWIVAPQERTKVVRLRSLS